MGTETKDNTTQPIETPKRPKTTSYFPENYWYTGADVHCWPVTNLLFLFLGELYGAQPHANPVQDWLIVKENNQLSTKLPKFDIGVGFSIDEVQPELSMSKKNVKTDN